MFPSTPKHPSQGSRLPAECPASQALLGLAYPSSPSRDYLLSCGGRAPFGVLEGRARPSSQGGYCVGQGHLEEGVGSGLS